MNQNKVIKLFHNKDFVNEINDTKTKEDIIELFNEKGADIKYEDVDEFHNLCERYILGKYEIEEDYLCASGGKSDISPDAESLIKKNKI